MSTVWTVDEFGDSLRERPAKVRTQTWIDGKTPTYRNIFDTEAEAKAFLVVRAANGVEQAKKELARAKLRHKKCLKKFSATLVSITQSGDSRAMCTTADAMRPIKGSKRI